MNVKFTASLQASSHETLVNRDNVIPFLHVRIYQLGLFELDVYMCINWSCSYSFERLHELSVCKSAAFFQDL